ncbi:MAG: alpha/beta fold hydrolase [Pseudomonadota bacterium]
MLRFKLLIVLIYMLSFVSIPTQIKADAELKFVAQSAGAGTTVIFIHGFRSSSDDSWKHRFAIDSVPQLVENDANLVGLNVAKVDYDSYFIDGPSIDEIAKDIATEIYVEVVKDNDQQRLIFVAHSLGGILSREVVLYNSEIKDRTLGIVTYATPMGGSRIADFGSYFRISGPVVRCSGLRS